MERRWIFPSGENDSLIQRLSRDLAVPEFVVRLLLRGGFAEPEAAADFLQPRLKNLSDPLLLPEMEKAATRTLQAVERGEKIALYGDYDVDGVSSLALLARVLRAFGASVDCFLPHRVDEGYGLSKAGVDRCLEEHAPDLLIAVDCGTNSVAEANQLAAQGVDLLILDHHEPSGARPTCAALVNPKLNGAFTYLCSGGVAFKFAHALLKLSPRPEIDLKDYLDLVALATVADIVPLVEENRILVHRGLHQMARTRWAGLRALMQISAVKAPIRSDDIGFRLGPRINASGRLGTARDALRLLLTDDETEAARLADSLDTQNRERQNVERHLIQEVEKWVDAHYDPARDACIVAGEEDWHHGVLGIVASRIMRRHHRPTLLIGFDQDGIGKGSGRSIEGLSLVEILGHCSDHLEKFGGHEMAAGLTVTRDRFDVFQTAFRERTQGLANPEILTPKLRLDAEITLDQVSHDFCDHQEQMEPYGSANARPLFAARGLTPTAAPRVLKEKHLRVEFQAGRQRVSAIYFQGATMPLPRPPWDVAFTVGVNEYNGRRDVQMTITALRSSVA